MPPPRRKNSAVDALVEALRHDIVTGTLKPGQRIDLDEWAERMEASRTPVRLALERLETEGFVKLSGRRGATIIDVTINHMEDVLATRLVLDAALGRAGTRNLVEEDLQILYSILLQIEAIKLPDDHVRMVEPALSFHGHLYQAAGASMMSRLAMQSVQHTNVFLSSMWFTNRRIAYVGKAHFRDLYEACELRDLDRVERSIRDYRINMAGVILHDRVRTDDLRILPGVLNEPEFARLRAIVDEGEDPRGPERPDQRGTPRATTATSGRKQPSIGAGGRRARAKRLSHAKERNSGRARSDRSRSRSSASVPTASVPTSLASGATSMTRPISSRRLLMLVSTLLIRPRNTASHRRTGRANRSSTSDKHCRNSGSHRDRV